ncbi:hypothetical protein [uncultured Alistipes sp.]|uniref:ADP-ribosyltransferase-containing protein n=1 Tax=uncultured Alistipes sp. TaxID=538949 RepID=UPI00272984F4|nr:hypothetical protein [uncultured Alistipes sp.]
MAITQAQKDYFTYTKIRDHLGGLVPCYHWTLNEFDTFDPGFTGDQSGDGGYFGEGFYFSARPGFNSCCWTEDGRQPIRLECYLDIRKPFVMDRLRQGPDYGADRPWLYDADTFLKYLKDNADDEDDRDRIVIDMEDDFIAYVRANPCEYEKYEPLVEAYEAGDIDWYEQDSSGTSMSRLYDWAERERAIVTPGMLTFGNIHRGLLEPYSSLVTAYAKDNGCDGIVSDDGDQPVEIVAFEPNQIKSVYNACPTRDAKFTDNSDAYEAAHAA